MERKMIKCLIFDLDGTLLFTKDANFISYKQAFEDLNIRIDKDKYDKAFGLRVDEMVKIVAPRATEREIKDVCKKKIYYYRKNIGLIKPNKVLIDFLKYVKPNYKIALATTASRTNAEYLLEHFKLKSAFDVIVYGEDVIKGKPHPECYTVCIKRCGVEPQECLIFEDSDVGVQAVLNANANVLRVLEQ